MNRVSMMLACAAMLFAVQPALASDDVSAQLAEMRELMQGLQQQVEAQDEQLAHQGQMLEQAQDVVRIQQGDGTSSGLDDFLDSISVGGHVAGSYNYNFNTPKGPGDLDGVSDGDGGVSESGEITGGFGSNTGDDGFYLPFHRDHNTFTIDQVWFSIGKPATEESRGGFQFDILYGQNANFLGQGTPSGDSRRDDNLDGTSDYYVAQAYVEYLCNCMGPEVNFKFGKFQTLVGAEVAQVPANFNITRGILYGIQPVDHLGLQATTNVGDMVELSAGIVNSGASFASSPDFNKEKSYIASAIVGDDMMSLRSTFVYGAEGRGPGFSGYDNHTRTGLVDLVATFNPSENVSLWANYDYLYTEGSSFYVNAVSIAGRVQVTDKIGAALRGEYMRIHAASSFPGSDEVFVAQSNSQDNKELFSLTGTVDYALTDHLTARAEIRFDWLNSPGAHGQGFFNNGSSRPSDSDDFTCEAGTTGGGNEGDRACADNQTVGLLEIVYEF